MEKKQNTKKIKKTFDENILDQPDITYMYIYNNIQKSDVKLHTWHTQKSQTFFSYAPFILKTKITHRCVHRTQVNYCSYQKSRGKCTHQRYNKNRNVSFTFTFHP